MVMAAVCICTRRQVLIDMFVLPTRVLVVFYSYMYLSLYLCIYMYSVSLITCAPTYHTCMDIILTVYNSNLDHS